MIAHMPSTQTRPEPVRGGDLESVARDPGRQSFSKLRGLIAGVHAWRPGMTPSLRNGNA
jgi:hypothetical protein